MSDVAGCAACGSKMEAGYCAQCGERRFRRLDLRRILGEVSADLLNLDTTWLRTLRALTWQPGRTVLAYIAGDRRRFVNPVKYLFVFATLFALAVIAFEVDFRPEELRGYSDVSLAGMHFVFGLLGYLAIIYLLPVAALQARLFRSDGLNVAETYASLCFFAGQVQLFLAIGTVTGILSLPHAMVLSRILAAAYLVFWNSRLFGKFTFGVLWRTLLVYAAYIVFAALVMGIAVVVAILLGILDVRPV